MMLPLGRCVCQLVSNSCELSNFLIIHFGFLNFQLTWSVCVMHVMCGDVMLMANGTILGHDEDDDMLQDRDEGNRAWALILKP